MSNYSEMNRDELIEALASLNMGLKDVEGTGANGYVKNSDIIDFLDGGDTMAEASFESVGEVFIAEAVDDTPSKDAPAKGTRV